ncbi:DUF805 domain-containing protein [Verminephrobacter aporrectodeae]|uniref:DUF805 domain-containing protein n=1 Tax=Verminephrobacter aporrectodeae subsp. tuberculatae TaxID=1110392 RepID=A0ABT3KN96_9BURK|nr:DUF805 domain-containing protein [Verminephrobacter aporrectodeae]MCW5221195.1 DUF805 domain-containing protein [Verminephrobacter aporrectodeae subsp. tuberculatae]MCW5290486.1 DUF805 domain-containing protein [Verminephrobacter aporrectodeae subsp. tuberculatae]MCW5319787.1 DUF805 domain-containing protein [Verminephrobacter aporrectodeae subsp. tuberculatae]MCW8176495.1 DUF805 domain-containing protein [Verminephrobacter aporrectodeae subsp. tuberculatae]MCW8198325.1 DUF805 domain-contai
MTFIQGDSIVGFFSAVKSCLRQYVGFSGRATRDEFWAFLLFRWLLLIGSLILSTTLNKAFDPTIPWEISVPLVMLLLFLPGLAVGARRLHDVGRSGWWLLLQLIPPLGYLVLLYWWVKPSKKLREEEPLATTGPI